MAIEYRKTGVFFAFILVILSHSTDAQVERFRNGLFNAELINNASLPGVDSDMNANLMFKSPMDNSTAGLQKDVAFDLNGPLGEGTSGGIFFLKQSAGILSKQYMLLNYANDIKLKTNLHVKMGVAFGFRNISLDQEVISQSYSSFFGNASDPVLLSYASKPPTFYTNLGITVFSKNVDLQVVLPNLSNYFKVADSSAFEDKPLHIGMGYQIPFRNNRLLGNNSILKLQVGFSKNFLGYTEQNTILAGATLSTSQGLSIEFFYNTKGAMNCGVGFDISDKYNVHINYLLGGANSSVIYGSSGQAILGFRFKLPKTKFYKKQNEEL
jgi:hypothetical protein